MSFFITENTQFFPHPYLADPDGLLAFSESLNPDLLLLAYRFGIFPWYNEYSPVMWWFTHPRCVLFPEKIKISKSMRQVIRSEKFKLSFNKCFLDVINNCQNIKRIGQNDTWITEELKDSFIELHNRNYAHSIEVWQDDQLVGGLYGMAIGKIFFGESMFAKVSNASKFGFIMLAQNLYELGFTLIDCQQETDHLKSLGAEVISAQDFLGKLRSNIFVPSKFLYNNLIQND